MNNKKITWIGFGLLVVLQLWTPAAMIWNKENVLKTGRAFKFLSAPVDPNDPFRGKYIILSFNVNSYTNKENIPWETGETVYVQLATDTAGYTVIHSLHKNKPAQPIDFVKTKINYLGYDSVKTVFIEWPFDRFYMEESKAYHAEQAYIKSSADSTHKTYALVKVKNGDAVLENVFINNIPIAAYIKK
jgi:uncharacterized membrane-anchored protein